VTPSAKQLLLSTTSTLCTTATTMTLCQHKQPRECSWGGCRGVRRGGVSFLLRTRVGLGEGV
jgi:hypothetical protein